MSALSEMERIVCVFAPLLLSVAGLTALGAIRLLRGPTAWPHGGDGPGRLLATAVEHMPTERIEWGKAMLAELSEVRGRAGRWSFALSCSRVALFPPASGSTVNYWRDAARRLGPVCGVLAILLPALSLPLLYVTAIAADRFTAHDDFFNGELVPGVVGVFIVLCLACMASGLPLGIAGLIRREQARWLSAVGPVWSVAIFAYLQVVQAVAGG